MTALQAALDHPERIEKLVLYGGSATTDLPSRFETLDETVARIEAETVEVTTARIAATWFVDGDRHPLFEFTKTAGAGASKEGAIKADARDGGLGRARTGLARSACRRS